MAYQATGEYYLRQSPLVVVPRGRIHRLPYAMAGLEDGRGGIPPWRSLAGERAALGAFGLGGTELPNQLTPLTAEAAAKALAEGYRRVTGRAPTQRVLALLIAQSAQETGQWKSMHNFNWGNAKATASDAYYQNFRCWELESGQQVWYDPPDPHCRFAAFLSAEDGAEHYIRLLQRRTNWWNGLHTGTVDGFVAGLTTPPVFFTGDPSAYAHRMTEFVSDYSSLASKYATEHPGTLFGAAIGGFALVFGGMYLYRTIRSGKRPTAA